MTDGLSPEAARREAMRQFGDLNRVRQSCVSYDHERERAMHRATLLGELRQDVIYALRVLRRNRLFSAAIILTLALGIGANSAIFTLVHAVLLQTLPVRDPGRLVVIGDPTRTTGWAVDSYTRTDLLSYRMYRALRENTGALTGVLASGVAGRLDVVTERGSEPEHPRGRFVSGNYFRVLGVPAARGRVFDGSEEATRGGAPVAVISDGYWTRRFDRDPSVIGRDFVVNGSRLTIIGVTPPGFTGEIVGQPTEVWLPLAMQPALAPNRPLLDNPEAYWLLFVGRLAPGATLEQARAAVGSRMRAWVEANPPTSGALTDAQLRDLPIYVSSGARGLSRVRSEYATPLLTLMAAVAVLLLIICANIANLLLARAVARTREIGVRLAIGAGRFRLVRQLLTESVVLAVVGAVVGLAVAWGATRLLIAYAVPASSSTSFSARPGVPVLLFTIALSFVVAMLVGVVPALRASRVDLATSVRAHARSITGSGSRGAGTRFPLGKALIVGQVALSLVLLTGAALLGRSLRSLESTRTGLDRDHLLVVDIDPGAIGYHGARLATLAATLRERFVRLPGVAAVSFSANGLFSGSESRYLIGVPGFVARSAQDSLSAADEVGPGYVHATGATLLRGREITEGDNGASAPVALVNESFARFYFPDGPAVGETFQLDSITAVRIVGVIADARDHSLVTPPERRFYLSYLQRVDEESALRFELRARGAPGPLVQPVRREIVAVDPQLPIYGIDPLAKLMRQSIRQDVFLSQLATGFGLLALLLAAIGLYGVMAYAVSRRTGEIGLRMALGAQRRDVVGMVLREAMLFLAGGVAIGLPLALVATRLIANQLHGVGAGDPLAIATALGVLGTSAVLAALVPAMGAARVAPTVALRED